MHFFSSKTEREKPIFPKKGTLSSVDFIFCCLNSAFSYGILKLGSVFTSGLIFTYIILIIVSFLSYYSLKLFVLSAAYYHEGTFEEIWREAFSKTTLFIPIFATIFSSLVNMTTYIKNIQSSIVNIGSKIVSLLNEDGREIINDLQAYKMLLGSGVFILFLLPQCISSSIHTMAIISFVSFGCIIFFLIYSVCMFGYQVKTKGFDITHSIKYFQINQQSAKSLAALIFAFEFYPLTYPGLRDCKDSRKSNLFKVFFIIIIFIFIIYATIGTFNYLTFFDENKYGIILDHFPDDTKAEKILLIIGHILTLFFVLQTIPFRLNSCRYVLLSTVNSLTSFPHDIWAFMGIIICLLALALSNLTDDYLIFLEVGNNIMASILLYIIPPILYIKAYKVSDCWHFTISIILLIVGILATIFMIMYNGFY